MIPISAETHGGKPPKKKVGKNPKRDEIQRKAKALAAIQSEINPTERGEIGPATRAGILE